MTGDSSHRASPSPPAPAPEVSVIIPVYDEAESLPQLHQEIRQALATLDRPHEILFVDDGSSDGTAECLEGLADADPHIHLVHLRKNFGKSSALAAGFERARGDIVVTLDADLQDDPAMIPEFVARIEAGADLVSGWKKRRNDPWRKTFPSKFFNWIVRLVSRVPLRDFNCGFKAYRIECIRELSVYGGFHRFLPVLASERGFRIEELVVQHRPRAHGTSKYGVGRFFDGFLDLLTVLLVTRFRTRPLHFFGIPGGLLGLAGLAVLTYLTVIWFSGEKIGTRPLLQLGVLLTITGGQFLAIGLVAELLVRTTVGSREIFSVRRERPPQRVAPDPAAVPADDAATGVPPPVQPGTAPAGHSPVQSTARSTDRP